ncbi:SPASM domain-containing protein [Nodularia spumigena CS-584]|nr:SPASM domain-containing protein [Nodularia spumigena]AHJ30082.1 Arylsulfatase regulator (Fe-S oxidoreductase) [Nodularia spumigena CCY9414]MDB9384418.1 SPASM domain-containing protein [Nodularia spumigena CS-584]
MLQRSHYNYFVKRQEGVIGYNARKGVFALLSPHIAELLQGNEPITEVRNEQEFVTMGFLHYGDEVEQIISKFENARRKKNILNFTILPTLACNFSCDYCFQGDHQHGQFMSPETQSATIRYIQSLIVEENRVFDCKWFGGEPLLAKETVLNMSRQLNNLADAVAVHPPGMQIITNGILLNSNAARELSEVGINSAQISFDSLVFKSSKKRGVMDATGEPSIILKNIIAAREHLTVLIRINVSSENLHEVPQMIEFLSKHGISNVYAERIHANESEFGSTNSPDCTSGACGACDSKETVDAQFSSSLSRSDYASFEKEHFLNRLLDRPETLKDLVKKLVPKTHVCGATLGNMHVIDPAGYVSRCWHSAGSPSEAMGNIHEMNHSIDSSDIAQRWQEFSPFAYPACKNCNVLPLCMGGCSHPRVFMDATEPPCDSIKQQIQFCVDQVGEVIQVPTEKQELVSR